MLKKRKSKERSTYSAISQQKKPIKRPILQPSNLSSSCMEMGLGKIRKNLIYNRYLAQLRNNQNHDAFLGNQIAQKNVKKHHQRFQQASQEIISNYANKFVRQAKQPQIKWSCQYKQSEITDQIIKISEKVDKFLERSYVIPKIQKQQQSNIKAHSQNKNMIDVRENIDKLDSYDTECINIQNQKYFQKHGVNLDLVSNYLSKKIKRMAFNSLDFAENSDNKLRTHKNVPLSLHTQLLFEPSTQNHNNFNNHFSFNSKTEKKADKNIRFSSSKKSNKQNETFINTTMMNSKDLSFLDSTTTKRAKKANLSEGDLETIFKNYQIKKQRYGKNKNLMTQKRQQAIFANQLIKIANKIQTKDIFSSLQFEKQLIKQQTHSAFIGHQQLRQVNKQTAANDLKQRCRKDFQYITNLDAQKL